MQYFHNKYRSGIVVTSTAVCLSSCYGFLTAHFLHLATDEDRTLSPFIFFVYKDPGIQDYLIIYGDQ